MNPKKNLKSFFKTNVIYGLLILVPSGVIFLLLEKIIEVLEKTFVALNNMFTNSTVDREAARSGNLPIRALLPDESTGCSGS